MKPFSLLSLVLLLFISTNGLYAQNSYYSEWSSWRPITGDDCIHNLLQWSYRSSKAELGNKPNSLLNVEIRIRTLQTIRFSKERNGFAFSFNVLKPNGQSKRYQVIPNNATTGQISAAKLIHRTSSISTGVRSKSALNDIRVSIDGISFSYGYGDRWTCDSSSGRYIKNGKKSESQNQDNNPKYDKALSQSYLDQAVQASIDGDNDKALEMFKKAKEHDPYNTKIDKQIEIINSNKVFSKTMDDVRSSPAYGNSTNFSTMDMESNPTYKNIQGILSLFSSKKSKRQKKNLSRKEQEQNGSNVYWVEESIYKNLKPLTSDVSAHEIFHRFLDKIGGLEKLSKISNFNLKTKTLSPNDNNYSKNMWEIDYGKKSYLMKTLKRNGKEEIRIAIDGNVGTFNTGKEVEKLNMTEINKYFNNPIILDLLKISYLLEEVNGEVSLIGEGKNNGENCFLMRYNAKPGFVYLFFEKESGLLAKKVVVHKQRCFVNEFKDYRFVSEMKFPFETTNQFIKNGKVVEWGNFSVIVEEIEINF